MQPYEKAAPGSRAPAGAPRWTGLFPASVVTVTEAELLDAPTLMAEEQRFVARAVPARALEFAIGRSCARAALARLGCPAVVIAVGEHREPVWPSGFIGSITHCPGHCAAAVARAAPHAADAFASLGLDAEPAQPLPADLVETVCCPAERVWMERRRQEGAAWDRLVFSAKESVFKCLFPILRRFVDFHEVAIALRDDGSFEVHAPGIPLAEHIAGRFGVGPDLIMTTAMLSNRHLAAERFDPATKG